MRFFSYLFHALLALFLFAVSGLAWATGSAQNLNLGMLPWTGATLTYVVFFSALFGLVSLLLALRGSLRFLFLLWALAVLVFLLKGYLLSGYRFHGGDWTTALYLMIASLLAVPGAWFQMTRRRAKPRY
jgi:hypothetical protein